jgi:hypothetical protein
MFDSCLTVGIEATVIVRGRHRSSGFLEVPLCQLYGRNWPLALMTPDRNTQAVEFIEPEVVDGARLSIGQDDAFAHKLRLGLVEFGENPEGAALSNRHDVASVAKRAAMDWLSRSPARKTDGRPASNVL